MFSVIVAVFSLSLSLCLSQSLSPGLWWENLFVYLFILGGGGCRGGTTKLYPTEEEEEKEEEQEEETETDQFFLVKNLCRVYKNIRVNR